MLHMLASLIFCVAGLAAFVIIAGTLAGEAEKIARALGYARVAGRHSPPARSTAFRSRTRPLRPSPMRPAYRPRAAA
jgi:hypothetical protein